MSKIVCDICGTAYPDTAESCPICGCTRDLSAEFAGEAPVVEEAAAPAAEPVRAKAEKAASKKREIFDYDEVNPMRNDMPASTEEEYEAEENEEEEESGSNTVLVVFLVVLITVLLVGAGFIFFKFFLPNMKGEETVPTTEAIVTEAPTTEATTEPTVPCTNLSLEAGNAVLNEIGQHFLLNVTVKPEDTTDTLTYLSEDESVATVSEDGRITAVAEGETVVYITCGKVQVTCPVVVKFIEETEAPTEETVDATEETVGEEVEETEPPKDYDPSITLKLKKTDISLGIYLSYQLMLDCNLEQDDVEWSVEHNWICKVDEFGNVTALQHGVTDVIVKYGDQEVRCKVRI